MKNQKLNYGIVGLFVIAMLAAAVVSGIALTGQTSAKHSYYVVFDNVADVRFGTQVRYEGFPVGQVEDIGPETEDGTTRFLLEISIDKDWPIPADSIARIGSSTFLGAKTVEIQRGSSETPVVPGERIASGAPADMFAAMSSVAGEFGDLSRDSLRPLLARMSAMIESANTLIDEDLTAFLGSLKLVAADVRDRVPEITGELKAFTENLNNTMGSVQRVLSDKNIKSVESLVQNIEAVSGEFLQISADVQGTLDQVTAVIADLDRIIEANEGKVGAMLDDSRYTLHSIAQNIDAINHNLSGTARNMNEFSRLIRQNPGLLLGGSPREEDSIEVHNTQNNGSVQ